MVTVVVVVDDDDSPLSFNFFNLSKYRCEANSVIWRGSMTCSDGVIPYPIWSRVCRVLF